jgi:hypothetical protein
MPNGSCLCGSIRIAYQGDAAANVSSNWLPPQRLIIDTNIKRKVICHCLNCRKLTGSAFSIALLIPEAQFHLLQGRPKAYAADADSGNKIVGFFCKECGSTMWRETPLFNGLKLVMQGTIDDDHGLDDEGSPGVELYTTRRVHWISPVSGAQQA